MKSVVGRLLVTCGIVLVTPGNASEQEEIRDMVIERRELMFSMLDAYWPLLNVDKGKSADFAKAADAALKIRDGMTRSRELFPAGSAKGEVEGTWSRAKPDIWEMPAEFEAAANELISASAKLAEVAQKENVEDFRKQFELFHNACFACHEFKPSAGGKFRFAH